MKFTLENIEQLKQTRLQQKAEYKEQRLANEEAARFDRIERLNTQALVDANGKEFEQVIRELANN